MRSSVLPWLCAAALLSAAAASPTSAVPVDAQPESLGDGISVSSLSAEKIDSARVRNGIAEIGKGTYGNIHSFLLFRNGKLVSESYFPGEDENNHKGKIGLVRHGRDTLHDVRSVSKTVVALALLIAHERGHIASLDSPLFDYFPEYRARFAQGEKAKITLKQALTMTAGLDWNEDVPYAHPANTPAKFKAAPDALGFVLSRPLVAPPGAKFTYNGGLTQLLAAIVERSTGADIEAFTKANLLVPLGVETSEWAKRADGRPDADSGLRLRSRDMAKIGLLIANKGKWSGQQIVPARLIEQAISAHIDIPQEGEAAALGDRQAYGYQLWIPSFLIDGKRVHLTELSGNGGQKVLIEEAGQIMVVITAGNYDRRGLKKSSIDIYFDIVHPAVLGR